MAEAAALSLHSCSQFLPPMMDDRAGKGWPVKEFLLETDPPLICFPFNVILNLAPLSPFLCFPG